MDEPILTESKNKHVLLPVTYPDVYEAYKKHVSVFWVPEELDFSKDFEQLEKMSENEKNFIFSVLGFFSQSDGLIMQNVASLSEKFPNLEIRMLRRSSSKPSMPRHTLYSLTLTLKIRRKKIKC